MSQSVSRSCGVFAKVLTETLRAAAEFPITNSKENLDAVNIRAICRAMLETAIESEMQQTGSTEARKEPARSSVSNAGGAHGYGRAADTGTPPIVAENVGAGGSPAESSSSDKNDAVEDAIAFLKSVEWTNSSAETDEADVIDGLRAMRSAKRPPNLSRDSYAQELEHKLDDANDYIKALEDRLEIAEGAVDELKRNRAEGETK